MKHLKTYQLAVELYKMIKTQRAPMNLNERDQLERASLSIVLNIAEGCGKPSKKDRLRFLNIAMGSLRETQCLLSLLQLSAMEEKADHLGALLYKFTRNPGGH